jgi:anti-anti-sigma factor
MILSEEKSGKVMVLGLTGKIDIAGTGVLVKRVTEILDSGERFILLDFKGITYINSSGLCALVVVGKRLAKSGGKLVLAEVSDPIQKVLKISGLAAFFTLQGTKAEALASFPE